MARKQFTGSFEVLPNYRKLDEEVSKLMYKAMKALENSHSPYSSFSVGAAVLMNNDDIVVGSNQENMSFPAGLCAERVALHTALQQYPKINIKSLAIIARSADKWTNKPITPCGICRQTMLEIVRRQNKSFSIYLGTKEGDTFFIPKAEYLMPLSFFHADLKKVK